MNKAYKISMLFDWQNGNTDLKKEHINGKGIPVVSSGVENTGIIGCTDVDARILPAHTITVDMFGNVYYRDFEYKEVTHARVFTLIPKGFELDVQTGLYFVSSLKVLSKIYSYDNMCSYAKISNMDISLPVIENVNPNHEYTVDDIDWQYMRDRITELERDRITELDAYLQATGDAYLQATGLNDYELTEDDVRYGKFVIGEIFNSQNGDNNLRKADVNGKGVPIIAAGVKNNGILGLSDKVAKVINANTITVDVFGNTYFRYFNYKMTRSVFSLELKEGALSEGAGIYICSELKQLAELFDYDNMCSFNKIKSLSIELPVIENSNPNHEYTVDDIDWQYMRDRITELERDRITELDAYLQATGDAYLQATGLNDYELTEDDKKILSLSAKRASDENGTLEDNSKDEVRFGEFDITKVFTVKNTKCIMQNQIVPNSGDIPYVTAGDGNNAISTYIDCPIEWIDDGNCVFIGGKTLVITYQEKDFCSNDSHNLALYLNNEEYQNGYVYRYMVGALKSALSHKYYWGDSISRKKIHNDKMLLPIKSDGTPDFDYMERYIRAMEKVVIADVVKYKDKVIETTKKVVGE